MKKMSNLNWQDLECHSKFHPKKTSKQYPIKRSATLVERDIEAIAKGQPANQHDAVLSLSSRRSDTMRNGLD